MHMSKRKFTAKDYLSQLILQKSVQKEKKTEIGNDFYWLTVRIDKSLSRPKKPYYWLKLLDTVYRQDLVGIKTADDYLESARYHAESPVFQGSDVDPLEYVDSLTPKEKPIFGTFLYLLKQTGNCYPSQNTIADWTGASVSTVKRTINKLVDDGILDYKYRHHKTSIFRLPQKFFELPHLQSLANVYGFLKISAFCLLSFNAANAHEPQYSTKIVKDIYKSQSSLRKGIVMSMSETSKNTFLPKVGEYNQKATPEDYTSCEDLDFFRQETYNPTPISKKTVSIGHSVAHDLSAYSYQERSDALNTTQTQTQNPHLKGNTRKSTLSPHTIALHQQKPPEYGLGLKEHVTHKYFTYEAFLHSPEGKKAAQFISTNVFQQEFDKYLQETGSTYDQAFNLFLTMENI